MDQIAVEDLEMNITAAREKLRSVDEKIGTLSGRLPRHQRISYIDADEPEPMNAVDRSTFGLESNRSSVINKDYQRDSTGGAVRRTALENRIERRRFDHGIKRSRPAYDNEDDYEEDVDSSKRSRKSIQSTVVMPALDSRGRDEKIEKLKESENKEVKNRNKRLFSNLLLGTLNNFKKTERKTAQQQKQEEVEKKLEEVKKKDDEIRSQEKNELIQKRKEQERELHLLQRKKALIQYAEIKIKQLNLMKGAIKTAYGPSIYWQPVKHTVRSMELQQSTERYLDELIAKREDELKADLASREKKDEEEEEEEDEAEEDGAKEQDDADESGDSRAITVVVGRNEAKRKVKVEEEEEEGNDAQEEEELHVELD